MPASQTSTIGALPTRLGASGRGRLVLTVPVEDVPATTLQATPELVLFKSFIIGSVKANQSLRSMGPVVLGHSGSIGNGGAALTFSLPPRLRSSSFWSMPSVVCLPSAWVSVGPSFLPLYLGGSGSTLGLRRGLQMGVFSLLISLGEWLLGIFSLPTAPRKSSCSSKIFHDFTSQPCLLQRIHMGVCSLLKSLSIGFFGSSASLSIASSDPF